MQVYHTYEALKMAEEAGLLKLFNDKPNEPGLKAISPGKLSHLIREADKESSRQSIACRREYEAATWQFATCHSSYLQELDFVQEMGRQRLRGYAVLGMNGDSIERVTLKYELGVDLGSYHCMIGVIAPYVRFYNLGDSLTSQGLVIPKIWLRIYIDTLLSTMDVGIARATSIAKKMIMVDALHLSCKDTFKHKVDINNPDIIAITLMDPGYGDAEPRWLSPQ